MHKIKNEGPKDTHAAFVRAIAFGVGGALIGLALYSAFTIITGLIIGYVSLAVGYIVGKALVKGSRGIGGRRYQVAAVALTYAAVSLSAIPIGIAQFIKAPKPGSHAQLKKSGPVASGPADSLSSNATSDDPNPGEETSATPKTSFASAIGALLFAGLASPFLELQDEPSGIIGIVILVVGIRIAWKLTEARPIDVVGPFNNSHPAPSAPTPA